MPPALAEALSIREDLSWLKVMHIDHTGLESNCFMVVNALNDNLVYNFELGLLINDFRLVKSQFQFFKIVGVYRKTNRVVHILAWIASCYA